MEKLLMSNIKTISSNLKAKHLTPNDLVGACLERAKRLQRPYNALITITEQTARTEAEQSTIRYNSANEKSPLDGIPIVVKDNFCTANIRTTCASRMLENFIPTYNATVYQRLVDAGAILIGKSNLDEFAMGTGTVDSIYGPTRNPWSYKSVEDFYISGGSSGGSAVAVTTGICAIGIGSDTGGSVRNPASYCGLIGLKPTYGLVSRFGLIPLVNSMDVPGILSRTVDDCVTILNTIAGHDPKDSTTHQRPYKPFSLPPADRIRLRGLKVGIPLEYVTENLTDEMWDTWNTSAQLLQDNGAVLVPVSLPNTKYSIVCYSILNQCEVASNMSRFDGLEYGLRLDPPNDHTTTEQLFALNRQKGFNETVSSRILAGNYFLLARSYETYFKKALKVRRLIANEFDRVWEQGINLLLTPTTLGAAPHYHTFNQGTNRDQCVLYDYCTQPANLAGIPAVSVPIKLSGNTGLPLSLQLIGPNFSESLLLATAKYIEHLGTYKYV